jgi:hypothetical protein
MLYKSLGFVKVEKVSKPTILFDHKPGMFLNWRAMWNALGWWGLAGIIILALLFGAALWIRAL